MDHPLIGHSASRGPIGYERPFPGAFRTQCRRDRHCDHCVSSDSCGEKHLIARGAIIATRGSAVTRRKLSYGSK